MPVISLRLPKNLEDRLDKAAKAKGLSRSELLRLALDHFLDSQRRNNYYAQVEAAAQKIGERGLGPDWEDWERLSDETLASLPKEEGEGVWWKE